MFPNQINHLRAKEPEQSEIIQVVDIWLIKYSHFTVKTMKISAVKQLNSDFECIKLTPLVGDMSPSRFE